MPDDEMLRLADPQARGRFADFLHQSLNHNIALADRKSSIVFTLTTAVTVFVLQQDPSVFHASDGAWLRTGWIATIVVLLLSAATAFGVVFPRINRRRNGLLFWSSVARHETALEYADCVACSSSDVLLESKFEHCHALANICQAKYRLLRVSMILAGSGLSGFVVASITSAIP